MEEKHGGDALAKVERVPNHVGKHRGILHSEAEEEIMRRRMEQ